VLSLLFKGEAFGFKIFLLSNQFSRDFAGATFFLLGGDEACVLVSFTNKWSLIFA